MLNESSYKVQNVPTSVDDLISVNATPSEGRLQLADWKFFIGVGTAAALISVLLFGIALWLWKRAAWEYVTIPVEMPGFTELALFFIAGFLFCLGTYLIALPIRREIQIFRRTEDAHNTVFNRLEEKGAAQTALISSQAEPGRLDDDLSWASPADCVAIIFWICYELAKGETTTPWELGHIAENGLFITNGNKSVSLGFLSMSQARVLMKKFETVGLIVNRRRGYAGEWCGLPFDEAVMLLVKEWK